MTDYLPDQHAQVLWNENEDFQITEICIVYYSDAQLQNQLAGRYQNSNGADTTGWLSNAHPIANPAGLFGYLAFRCGFHSKAVATECLREFAQIEGCAWAREMLAAIEKKD